MPTFGQQVRRYLKARKLERKGKVKQAVELYEQNVEERFMGNRPYDRLAAIYRKQERPAEEARVLQRAIDVFTHDVPGEQSGRRAMLRRFRERLTELKAPAVAA